MRLAAILLAISCGPTALVAADAAAPAPAPAPAAAAPAPIGGKAEPAVNQSFLDKATAAAGVLAEACKATGVSGKLGGMLGGAKPAAKSDDQEKLAIGLKNDLQALHDSKQVTSDGAFAQLCLGGKDAIVTKFKGVAGADKLQAAFADDGIGKALVNATPVDQVPGYQKSVDSLNSLVKK